MCDACLEMELYFAYLKEVEERKKAEQSGTQLQCEPVAEANADQTQTDLATPRATRFVCDKPE